MFFISLSYDFVCSSHGLSLSLSLSLTAEISFICKTPAIADIVILVDGSWSIGRFNFRLVRTFLESLVTAFSIRSDQTRIGETLFLISYIIMCLILMIHNIYMYVRGGVYRTGSVQW